MKRGYQISYPFLNLKKIETTRKNANPVIKQNERIVGELKRLRDNVKIEEIL